MRACLGARRACVRVHDSERGHFSFCTLYVAFCAVVQAKEKAKEERRAHEGKVQSLINRGDGIRSVLVVPRVP